jgi:predicted ATPase
MKNLFRLVITGGPCGGKTSIISNISHYLKSLGYNVYLVPEAATLMILGGVSLLDKDIVIKQYNLINLQKQLEDTFYRIALDTHSDNDTVIICDRGIIDNKAYVSSKIWELLKSENYHLRYDGVIHLVSAAIGAQEYYTLENNTARSESLNRAALLDLKIREAWKDHTNFEIVENTIDFKDKIKRTIQVISKMLSIKDENLPFNF